MSPAGVFLDAAEIGEVFPFHVAFDRELRVVQAGRSWARVCPEVRLGAALADLFVIARPAIPLDFDQIAAQAGRSFVLRCIPVGLTLRGQVRCPGGGDRALFLVTPWASDMDELPRLGLTLDDFPSHEPTSDYLLLIQSQRRALRDLRALSADSERREAMLRAVLDTAAEGIIVMGPDGIIRSFNAAAGRIFGYEPSRVIGRNVTMLMPQAVAQEHDRFVQTYLRTGEAHVVGSVREVEGLRSDGATIHVELAVSESIVDDARQFTGILRDLTERRRLEAAEARLTEAEAGFRQTLTALKAGTWSFDLRAGTGFWSDENYDLMGVPRSVTPTPELFLSCIHPDDAARSREVMRRALAGEAPLEGEDRVILPGGSIRWIQSIGVVLRDEQGAAVGLSGITVDVSERHRAEESAQEARKLGERRSAAQRQVAQVLAAAMTASEAIQGTLRVVGQTLGWHFGAGWLLDPESDRMVCCCSWVGGAAEHGSRLRALRRTSCARGEGLAGSVWEAGGLQVVRLDEPGMTTRSNRAEAAVALGLRTAVGAPIFRDGAVVGVLEFACAEADDLDPALRNLFDTVGSQLGESLSRLEAVDALRSSERQLRGVIDASLDAVISIDALGRIVDWNPQAERIFGWSAIDALGRSIQDLIIPEEMREAHRRGLAHYHATGQGPALNQRLELEALHRDGHRFPIEIAIATLHPWSADGRTRGLERRGAAFSAFVRDISERRRAEVALRVAKEEAERAAQARSDFLATMSHEIRTPLNGVIGMLNLALKQDMPAVPREQLDVARRSANMLLAVTNDVLDLSKIEAGRMVLDEAPVDLAALVDDVIATARPLAADGVTVSASFSGGQRLRVLGDALRIRQILVNLVGNAVKFTPSGRVQLTVSVPAADGAPYRFTVEDTGIGIPTDRHGSIFEVFTQAGRSTSRRYGGTGLGLPISSQLASLMGGSVRLVHSSPAGSRFELELPLSPAPDVAPGDTGGGDVPLRVSGRVLVVDDNAVNRTIAAAMIAQLGCEVVVCADGPAALQQITSSHWDLVFMDCEMPDMDGYETTRRVRAAGVSAEALPIVAMTASALPQDRVRALDAGMNDHLTKPLLEDALARMLMKWMKPAGAPEAAVAAPVQHVVELSAEDREKIRRTRGLIGATPGAWEEVVGAFLANWVSSRAAMTEAASAGDWMTLCRIAHDVKGMSAMLGAGRLASLAGAIEQTARGSSPDCVAMLPSLDAEFDAVRAVVTGGK